MEFWEIVLYTVSYFGLYTAIFFMLEIIENRKRLKNPAPPKDLPKVTVIVPACNEESCLAKTLDSLLALDYPRQKLEIIVVDDGSKDRTLEIAKGYEKKGVRVFTKPNGGKGTALNFALTKATGEFVGCLDADSIVMPSTLKKMIGFFKNPKVMAVTPSLKCTAPKTVLQKIQVIEFMMGVYLRKVFSFLGSIHVTPGPFTIFRKKFFDTHGGYDTTTCTEDTEISLRIQHLGYTIENAVDANVYAVAMPTFKNLQKQRVRWYKGFLENTLGKYRHMMFSPKFGNLGMFVLPTAYLSVLIAIIMTLYSGYLMIHNNYERLVNLYNVNFDVMKLIRFHWDTFYINQSPLMIIGLVALSIGIAMIVIAKRASKEPMPMAKSYIFFMLLYLPLYAYWWVATIHAKLKKQDIGWKGRERKADEIKYA